MEAPEVWSAVEVDFVQVNNTHTTWTCICAVSPAQHQSLATRFVVAVEVVRQEEERGKQAWKIKEEESFGQDATRITSTQPGRLQPHKLALAPSSTQHRLLAQTG
ncbi:hypothetical protein GLAREA_05041 [Glarea lozoyensis ATCC 20868]|uniref:Uncharacterized protein n=1 Tax=Glarea lozoyensis (strain ATCC 20868 / MF5171) TaxID=1116229 RepID=S3DF22_GLAL2|nr:uncharacterized protein GLAREA_05041 [Glarea lozoyensis ATCC 20868]EPE35704.1 hypothetical protein GLAREA_05041 [Glarea lozoyensis ATCC 20868]